MTTTKTIDSADVLAFKITLPASNLLPIDLGSASIPTNADDLSYAVWHDGTAVVTKGGAGSSITLTEDDKMLTIYMTIGTGLSDSGTSTFIIELYDFKNPSNTRSVAYSVDYPTIYSAAIVATGDDPRCPSTAGFPIERCVHNYFETDTTMFMKTSYAANRPGRGRLLSGQHSLDVTDLVFELTFKTMNTHPADGTYLRVFGSGVTLPNASMKIICITTSYCQDVSGVDIVEEARYGLQSFRANNFFTQDVLPETEISFYLVGGLKAASATTFGVDQSFEIDTFWVDEDDTV